MPQHALPNGYEARKEESRYIKANHNNNCRSFKTKNDQFTLERDHQTSAPFNYACEVDAIPGDKRAQTRVIKKGVTPISDESEYAQLEVQLGKNLLLQEYFRSAERQKNAVYQNLCRGCGYGVFAARGQLCNFCECIVHGVAETEKSGASRKSRSRTASAGSADSAGSAYTSNIYENICDKCARVYGDDECLCLQAANASKTSSLGDKVAELQEKVKISSLGEKAASAENVTKKSVKKHTKPKRDKQNIFYGLIGSLKRATTPRQAKKSKHPEARLQIVHNVDGYDNVFRTQESFDLGRILELKLKQNSVSDQHIYGRLKTPDIAKTISSTQTLPIELTPSQSHDQLVTTSSVDGLHWTQSGSANKRKGRRARLSQPRLLRASSQRTCGSHATPERCNHSAVPQALYLTDSVCHWMTSLRRETHNYHSFGCAADDASIALCNTKSIPARNAYEDGICFGAPPSPVTNSQLNGVVPEKFGDFVSEPRVTLRRNSDASSSNSDASVTLRRHAVYGDTEESDCEQEGALISPVQHMIKEFKRNLRSKQMQQQKQASTCTRQRENRSKRQAIYLADQPNEAYEESRPSHEVNSSDNNPNNHANGNNARDQATMSSNNSTTALRSQGRAHVVSRRGAPQPRTPPSKRCGIYERDSEFVNDILCAFDTFLQREAETSTTEVGQDASINEDRSIKEVDPVVEPAPLKVQSNHSVCAAEPHQTIAQFSNLVRLIAQQALALGLNRVVIYYGQPLHVFLHSVYGRERYAKYALWPQVRLVKKFRRFYDYCETVGAARKQVQLVSGVLAPQVCSEYSDVAIAPKHHSLASSLTIVVKLMETNVVPAKACKLNESTVDESTSEKQQEAPENHKAGDFKTSDASETVQGSDLQAKKFERSVSNTPPKVPQRDPRTVLTNKTASPNENSKPPNFMPKSSGNQTQNPNTLPSATTTPSTDGIDKEKLASPAVKLKNLQSTQSNQKSLPKATNNHKSFPPNSTPPLPVKRESRAQIPVPLQRKMTIPTADKQPAQSSLQGHKMSSQKPAEDEEDIYQPIWKFKTVGEVAERYITDADYYEADGLSMSNSLATDDTCSLDVEDHGEWETDDEFMFTTQRSASSAGDVGTVRSTRSNTSTTGSTVTGFGSSTATLASALSSSLTHHLFRNIGIFYSLTEPKLRAIIYDYDRVHAPAYFANRRPMINGKQSAISSSSSSSTASSSSATTNQTNQAIEQRLPMPPPRSTSISQSDSRPIISSSSGESAAPQPAKVCTPMPKWNLLPDSVQAWKFMLLDVNYLEDEEDMIVSQAEILRAQEIKDDIDSRQTQQLTILQRFKSASIGNLIDLPIEDDKKSIAERMRNKLQRGVFKLNMRSPKSEKKSRGIFRRAEATSLYLEDGMKPKYPIFGAPLDQLELNLTNQPNVPRFVVDSVAYIERKDCIHQDGLYRASGNKVSIDELKQKLSESYIYDPKLLLTDDIHTLTSLLKLFFRELGAPLIPQETYERLAPNLNDPSAIDGMREAFEEMREPNRSTLKFLIKHLTNVAACSTENRMPASNLAIVWGPCLLSANQIEFDIGRMNTLAKVLIENYERIFRENERLVS